MLVDRDGVCRSCGCAAVVAFAGEDLRIQPLGPDYAGCGCSFVTAPQFHNGSTILFQDIDSP
ncbi:MAG: hypothetical protein ABIO58_03600 [Luteimonas sp.]